MMLSGNLALVAQTVGTERPAAHSGVVSPVFGDIAAKMSLAVDEEVERLLRLGIPLVIDRGNGVEVLTARPSR
jgi:hypothetical protein